MSLQVEGRFSWKSGATWIALGLLCVGAFLRSQPRDDPPPRPRCASDQQPYGEVCVSQRIADFVGCVQGVAGRSPQPAAERSVRVDAGGGQVWLRGLHFSVRLDDKSYNAVVQEATAALPPELLAACTAPAASPAAPLRVREKPPVSNTPRGGVFSVRVLERTEDGREVPVRDARVNLLGNGPLPDVTDQVGFICGRTTSSSANVQIVAQKKDYESSGVYTLDIVATKSCESIVPRQIYLRKLPSVPLPAPEPIRAVTARYLEYGAILKDEDGEPISGVKVRAASTCIRESLTDARGHVGLTTEGCESTGRERITFSKSGFQRFDKDVVMTRSDAHAREDELPMRRTLVQRQLSN